MRLIDADLLTKKITKWLKYDPDADDRMVNIDDIAVSVLMEIEEQPTVFDADKISAAISALDKQTPRKVIFVHPLQDNDNGDYMCPTCNYGTVYNAYGHQSLFCPYCGQKLDWSE